VNITYHEVLLYHKLIHLSAVWLLETKGHGQWIMIIGCIILDPWSLDGGSGTMYYLNKSRLSVFFPEQ
jgi:hypothetical protein